MLATARGTYSPAKHLRQRIHERFEQKRDGLAVAGLDVNFGRHAGFQFVIPQFGDLASLRETRTM